MYEFFKSESYIQLILDLQELVELYSQEFENPFESGFGVHNYNVFTSCTFKKPSAFFSELYKITISTPKNEISKYSEFISEIRENIIRRISRIPLIEIARELFIDIYEKKAQIDREQMENLGVGEVESLPFAVFGESFDDVEFINITPLEMIEKWKNGSRIERVQSDEEVIKKILKYFDVDREFVHFNASYCGVGIFKKSNLDSLEQIANDLILNEYIGYMHKYPFKTLMSGQQYFEPIKWKGNLAELNKFIKSLYSFNVKTNDATSIEWKSFSKIFLVNNTFPDADKLKGASNAKIGSARELHPFWQFVNNSIDKN